MARGLISGDIVRATLVATDGEQTALLNFHYECGIVAGGSATDADFASKFDAAIGPDFKLVLNNNVVYRGTIAQVIFPTPIMVRQTAVLNAGAGSAGAVSLPRQTAGLTSWRTQNAGRAFRGRTFWPFPATTDDISDGKPSNSYLTRIFNICTDLTGFVTVTGAGAIAVHFGVFHARFNSTTPITDFEPQDAWATQKRRGTFGRANKSPI